MEKEFVSYEQAVALKELGFNEMCFGFYGSPVLELMHCKNSEPWMGNGVVAAPLKSQVFRWLSLQLNDKDIMIPVDYDAQNKLIDVLIGKLKTKHLLF